MSIEKIRELNNLAKQMEEMKRKAMREVITDRKELRVQALCKIQDYLKEMSNATEGFYWTAETNVTIFWLVKQCDVDSKKYNGVEFTFVSNGTVNITQYSGASTLSIKDFTNMPKDKFYRITSDNKILWEDGMVELIERWSEIKPYIESCAEKKLIERMNKTQNELANFKASYEKVVDFKV